MSDISPATSEVIELADIARPHERLRAGDIFVELRHDSIASRAAALEALLGRISETDTKLVWIGNPLRSPLTVERVFLQAAGPQADLRVERSPAELAAMLQSAAEGAARCLFIVQQPETLDPEARDTLARMAPLLAGSAPTVQWLFCCTNAFRSIAPPPPVVTAQPNVPVVLPAPTRLIYETIPEPRSSHEKVPLLLVLLIAGLGSLVPSPVMETRTKPPAIVAPAMAESATLPAPISNRDPTTSSSSPAIDVVALRRDFDEFLAQQSPHMPRLTQDQRDALFGEFLARQQNRSTPNKL